TRTWFSYQRYHVVHESHMEALTSEGLVLRDTLTFRELYNDDGELHRVNLRGRIVCAYGALIVVNEGLRVRRGPAGHYEVLGEFYAYHSVRRGRPRVNLAR